VKDEPDENQHLAFWRGDLYQKFNLHRGVNLKFGNFKKECIKKPTEAQFKRASDYQRILILF
jgi:hypothetical protein